MFLMNEEIVGENDLVRLFGCLLVEPSVVIADLEEP